MINRRASFDRKQYHYSRQQPRLWHAEPIRPQLPGIRGRADARTSTARYHPRSFCLRTSNSSLSKSPRAYLTRRTSSGFDTGSFVDDPLPFSIAWTAQIMPTTISPRRISQRIGPNNIPLPPVIPHVRMPVPATFSLLRERGAGNECSRRHRNDSRNRHQFLRSLESKRSRPCVEPISCTPCSALTWIIPTTYATDVNPSGVEHSRKLQTRAAE
jgi:hypothetical protein